MVFLKQSWLPIHMNLFLKRILQISKIQEVIGTRARAELDFITNPKAQQYVARYSLYSMWPGTVCTICDQIQSVLFGARNTLYFIWPGDTVILFVLQPGIVCTVCEKVYSLQQVILYSMYCMWPFHRAPVHLESYPGKDWPGSISS